MKHIKMIPSTISMDVKSSAEAKIFHDLKKYPGKRKFTVLHSLGLAEHEKHIFGEIDFVIICAKGILCVEVKGGEVGREGGLWYYKNRFGKTAYKEEGPYEQAQGNMNSLRTILNRRCGKFSSVNECQYACCVIMPDCIFKYKGVDGIPQITFDADSYGDWDKIIDESFAYWNERMQSLHQYSGRMLSDREIDSIANYLRGDFHCSQSIGNSVRYIDDKLCHLTKEQYDVLEAIADNDRTLVNGPAGCGKTLLALEQLQRKTEAGEKALYLCFNKNLAEVVREELAQTDVVADVYNFHTYLEQFTGTTGEDSEYYEHTLPNLYRKRFDLPKYDYLIVDEGQDLFQPGYLKCMDKMLEGGLENGSWLIFYDNNQNIYNHNENMQKCIDSLKAKGASFKLTLNCRNTGKIAQANQQISCVTEIGRTKIPGINPGYFAYNNLQEEYDKLIETLEYLKQQGITPDDIVILSKYKLTNPKNCLCGKTLDTSIGLLKTTGNMSQAEENEIRFSTVASFKGLESKVIILLDVDDFASDQAKKLNYVAVSRAVGYIFIMYDRSKQDDKDYNKEMSRPKPKANQSKEKAAEEKQQEKPEITDEMSFAEMFEAMYGKK